MPQNVIGRDLRIFAPDLAPDVFNPGSQIVFVFRAAGRIAESIRCVVVRSARQALAFFCSYTTGKGTTST